MVIAKGGDINMARNKLKERNFTGYKILIYPTDEQKERLTNLFGFSRFVYNWGIAEHERSYYEDGVRLSFYDLVSRFSKWRQSDEAPSWILRYTQKTAAMTLKHVSEAFIKFFNGESKYPKFKRKSKDTQKVHFRNDYGFKFRDNHFIIDNFGASSPIKCGYHHIPRNVESYYDITISTDGYDKYWLSLTIKDEPYKEFDYEQSDTIGIDVGIKHMATCSDGSVYDIPSIVTPVRRLKKLQRRISKDYNRRRNQITINDTTNNETKTKSTYSPKGKNQIKRERKLQKCYDKISNIINTAAHMASADIIKKNPKRIVMEDLNIPAMKKCHSLARAVTDAGMGVIRRYVQYKAYKRNIQFDLADRYYPSSQICSVCGHRQRIGSSRIYICRKCGAVIDRDLNASINLKNWFPGIIYPII